LGQLQYGPIGLRKCWTCY